MAQAYVNLFLRPGIQVKTLSTVMLVKSHVVVKDDRHFGNVRPDLAVDARTGNTR